VNHRITVALLALGFLAGCSGIKTYPNTSAKNLVVLSEIDSGSMFSTMRAALHVHQVDAGCRTEYQGTVRLDRPSIEVGIPPDRFSYLVFTFEGSSFLGGSSSMTNVGTLLKPRAGYRYELAVTYRDNIYDVVIRERDPRRRSSREVAHRSLETCDAS
jgi:hypothetical protein